MLVTCLVDVFEPDVGEAAVTVLRAAGCEVTCNLDQTCCGQPAWNAGFVHDAAAVAGTTLGALERDLAGGAEAVVVPAGSCATMVRKMWPELFELDGDHDAAARARAVAGRTFELSELLATRELPPMRLGGDGDRGRDVALHHSCHLLRELRVRDQPEALLRRVEGCRVVAWPDAERCCGFGGMFSFKLPETAEAMADDKLESLASTGADLVVGGDSSCLMHLRTRAEAEGHPIETRHLAQVLAAGLAGTDA